jgi:hypothetical protein
MAIMTIRDELRAAVESRHSRFHPYYQMWREGTLKREAIAGWVQEHYHFTRDVRWLNAVMPCRVPYADVRATYQESIDEEEDPTIRTTRSCCASARRWGWTASRCSSRSPCPPRRRCSTGTSS